MAEEEGFEPREPLSPCRFQDRSLQPDLGIPLNTIFIIYERSVKVNIVLSIT